MMISTRGRYALRFLIDLAEHQADGYVPMKEISARQGISLKNLEQILPALARAGDLQGLSSKRGGYRSRTAAPSACGAVLLSWRTIILIPSP